MGDVDSVRVALRVRPLVKMERDRGCQEAVEKVRGAAQVIVNRTDTFTFNYVFDARDTQEHIYQESVSEMLDKLFCGFNGTILAYGQTGSGKTHTMGTAFNGELNEHVGVIPRAMHDIFERVEKMDEFDFVLTCSFMELYQEQLFDLLSPLSREQSIVDMRENKNGIIIPGLTEQVVRSARETTDCLMRGSLGRAVASTAMNEQSSRSHAIFTVTIQATRKDEMKTVTTSKFHLVDLAGSERSKKTKATGDRFKEGVKINQGLLALGNVISALGSGQGSGFVRYRDSKLTRLLQDSLGGNSITLMIACISPADYNVAETLSTLRYADRARQIKNKPIVNQDPHAAEINHLKGIIQKLRVELLTAQGGAELGSVALPAASANTESKVYYQLKEKCHNLQQQLQLTLHDVAENEMRAHIAEAAHEKLKGKMDEMKVIVEELSRDFTTDDTSVETMLQNVKRVQQIHNLVESLDAEFERTQTEIDNHKRCYDHSMNGSCAGGADDSDDAKDSHVTIEIQEQTEHYTNKQMNFQEQLRRINRELNLKVELHQRVAGNLTKFNKIDDNMEDKFKECETKIQELETEKSELLDKLRHVKENASVKLAEERRKRLQNLEKEIDAMKRKNLQQSKLLKVREKETQKIKNLHTEIQAMKESKVKLIRAMRQESENFRQWKMAREKEVMQLKNKDRKMQNEMARKEALHNKQRNVLKRKCEEAMSINKRLKDALERQTVAQTQRQKMQSAKGAHNATNKIEQVIAWVERELEVIISLVDAEHSLEQLMEDRGIISRRIDELRRPPVSDTSDVQELSQLEEDLEMRNAQITDLQQKVCAADLDARMRSLYDGIQSLGEARAVLKHLLKSISEMRRERSGLTNIMDEMSAQRDAAEERCKSTAKRMRLMELEHEEAIAERENTYEEKIAVLLRELHNAPQLAAGSEITPEQEERLKIQEEQLNKMDTLREELEYYKNLVTDMRQAVKEKTHTKKVKTERRPVEEESDIQEISSSEDEFKDDSYGDPDWFKTPAFRKRNRSNNQERRNKSSDTSSITSAAQDETYLTAASSGTDTNANARRATTTAAADLKRKSKGCSCRGNCTTKRCGCNSIDERCTPQCRCSKSCINGKFPKGNDDADTATDSTQKGNKENGSSPSTTITSPKVSDAMTQAKADDANFIEPHPSFLTPKMARVSTLPFETSSVKRVFFD